MLERSVRYNIKGKKYINTLAKYYFTDMSLRDDSFKKVLIVKDEITPYRNDDGYLIVGLFDFLLKPEIFEKG